MLSLAPGKFEVVHKAFALRPEPNEAARFTEYHLAHRARAREMTGFAYDLPQVGAKYPSSSLPALIAAKYVQMEDPERFDCFDLGLFSAFFERTEDISDSNVIEKVADGCGLDGAKVADAISDRKYIEAVLQDHNEAQRTGINGVPAVIIGRQVISGAVSADRYMGALGILPRA